MAERNKASRLSPERSNELLVVQLIGSQEIHRRKEILANIVGLKPNQDLKELVERGLILVNSEISKVGIKDEKNVSALTRACIGDLGWLEDVADELPDWSRERTTEFYENIRANGLDALEVALLPVSLDVALRVRGLRTITSALRFLETEGTLITLPDGAITQKQQRDLARRNEFVTDYLFRKFDQLIQKRERIIKSGALRG